MEVVVTCEFRFEQTPDGKVWTSSAFAYDFWLRYLEVFDNVIVVARAKQVDNITSGFQRVCGEKVSIEPLPHYIGFGGLLKNAAKIRKVINQTVTPQRAVIYRVPSQSAMLATVGLNGSQNYALEVVGDPYDVFNAGITHSFLDKLLARISYFGLKRMASKSLAGCYVTNAYLQQRYPVPSTSISVGCSDIELNDDDFANQARVYQQPAKQLVFIGSFGQLYKGPDILINAIAQLKAQGKQYHVTMLGGGAYLEEMKTLAKTLNCEELIQFIGEVSKKEVNNYLEQADVFIMPSRTEGLPRALIEAMAKGLPCIASSVGGIPELLDQNDRLLKNDAEHLAAHIASLCSSTDKLNRASIKNLTTAQHYRHAKLTQVRKSFYQQYHKIWLDHQTHC